VLSFSPRATVLVIDKSLYDIWALLGFDVSSFEKAEERLGKLLTTDNIAEKVLGSLNDKRLSSQQLIVWKAKISNDNQIYHEVLGEVSGDLAATAKEIEEETHFLLKVFKKIDAGMSFDDADLVANAKWIRTNTRFEPLIVTDDRDLLTCGHALSLFFGLALGFLSAYEVLRLSDLGELIPEYCRHYALRGNVRAFEKRWSKVELQNELTEAMRKSKLACHPTLRNNDSFERITRS
jgi:uncharacterized protein YkuJ